MKTPLKPGDRVAVYGRSEMSPLSQVRGTATVMASSEHGLILCHDKGSLFTSDRWWSPKQCRRLIKKKKPPRCRVWIGLRKYVTLDFNDSFYEAKFTKPDIDTADGAPWIEFVEARPRKKERSG